jgi:PBSX family phage terminase large subunit
MAAIVLSSATLNPRVYAPYGAARKLWGCKDDEILMDGPARTGKTRAILEKIHLCLMKYPGARGLIGRKTRESMSESALEVYENAVLTENDPIAIGPKRNLRQKYNYPNGSELVIFGADKISKAMSTEYDIIGLFEGTEFSEDDVENLTTRLSGSKMPYHQLIVDCNPGPPKHWLNRRCLAGKMTRLLSRHEDNPRWWDMKKNCWTPEGERYIANLDRLTGHRYLRLRKGIWAAAEGLVYENYDPNIHLIDRFTIPPHWRKIRVIDFGFTNPFVCLWFAIDPTDGRMYLYREIYMTRRLVQDHAKKIIELSEGEVYECTIADHDAEDRATLHNCGIQTIPAYKAITPGIEAVSNRLRADWNGKPGLMLMRGSLVEKDTDLDDAKKPICTEEEYDSYLYPKGDDGKPIKEEPLKLNDHGMDTTRYGVAYVDDLAANRFGVTAAEAETFGNTSGMSAAVATVYTAPSVSSFSGNPWDQRAEAF